MRAKVLSTMLLVGALGLACDSGKVTEDDLIGTWSATLFVVTDFNNPDTDFNVLQFGGSVTLVLRANGSFTITLTIAGFESDATNGAWDLVGGDVLVFTMIGETDGIEFDIDLNGSTLDVFSDDMKFDFGGGEIPVKLDAKFVKV